MSDSSKRKRPLVADKRYPSKGKVAAKKPAKKPTPKKPATKRKAAPKRAKRGGIIGLFSALFRWIFRLIWKITWRITAVAVLVLSLAVGYFYTTLPPLEALLDGRARGSVTMQDRYGDVFAWRGDQFGGVVTADSVSRHLKNAVIATEDKRFYRHFGISPRGIASAVRINLSEGRGPLQGHGGSTITQQVAKLLCLGEPFDPNAGLTEKEYESACRRTSLQRKAKEALFSMAMEVKYTKNDILSIYLNRAYMGGGAFGAEAAAQRFFGKPAAAVNAAEGAMLAGLLTAPTTLSPTNNLDRSQSRAATVIRLMREQGYLTEDEAAQAQANPAELSEAAEAKAGGYFADWVMSTGPEFFTRNTTEDVIIKTTLDQRMQKAAEEGLKWVFDNKVREGSKAQAAIVVMSADGAVRAMVGGRKTKVAGAFNRATQALRQTGSAFKPFVYAAALDLGYSPNDLIDDSPFCMTIPGSGEWCPKNYTKRFEGMVTMTQALKDSLNVPAVKISESVGRDLVSQVASQFGIQSDLAAGPALALGASESTLIEMAGAYAGILNGGSSVTPYGLVELRLQGDEEPLMGTGGGIGERVIQESAARQLVYMMEKVISEGSGQRGQFGGRQLAGKTGTTSAAKDAWFIGFSADYVAGVWMGYDDNTPLSGVTGGGLPTDIWREVMSRVHEGLPLKDLPMSAPAPLSDFSDESQGTNLTGNGGGAGTVIDQILNEIFGKSGSGSNAPNPEGGDR
ncbi:PBP1A family penicillin-binding protein [Sulfitobacter mediterraneus]|uniref:transglycosylase domain-containing protein n=1 Tax=Sulfitobacter mediterraneus TaxID=83219 RepID=UPI001933C66B|nr:PBP1A family penicillin-binding protein [Sulfitobacter mediterraneus]MBM1633205.1 PBP1A family penicillin-binding protein [Sulfitobacter mediterraneus]MBM1640661.1 PBP1A family penicillin-binding protein [Sulfitobacter mediterraneus]MBM1645070.1 PBP1A family penicillin-binding protein [Sulfitobacter mediterraneus]MBM1648781.1 PBP1A family penicillin-binding protein [Sulfitobacter mediterraneus]MBM1652802.1 PBP1A family penicillin-binding protein [Sulfitobacter mediterraneus]